MAKGKGKGKGKGKAKRSKKSPAAPTPLADPALVNGSSGSRPPGQRHYDLPYSAPAPRLINPEVGLHNLVARAGHNAAYEIDVTLLDAPDHRLIRSGVLLAHRVLDGRGEWFLTAPDWQPLLPRDRIELMGHADLPDELADLIRPLRRRATLGPVAALACDRREFALRDDQGTTMALLRDDKVTVRRGGLTTARYREVMITPIGPGLNDDQTAWLDRALIASGATYVSRFPRLVTRLGAPATGPTDLPEPAPYDPAAPVKRFVAQTLGRRLRAIVTADLAVRGGDLTALGALTGEADALRAELAGLADLLEPDWAEELDDELEWLSARDPADPGLTGGADPVLARLRSERYLTLLERLVSATRMPRLTEVRGESAAEVLAELAAAALDRFRRGADELDPDADPSEWSQALTEIRRVRQTLAVTAPLLGTGEAVIEQLDTVAPLLEQVELDQARAAATETGLEDLGPAEAFAAGREFERALAQARRNRRACLKVWHKARKRLDG